MDSLECDCCFAVGVLYMMGERLAWIEPFFRIVTVSVAAFAVGVLYMMGERLAWIAFFCCILFKE